MWTLIFRYVTSDFLLFQSMNLNIPMKSPHLPCGYLVPSQIWGCLLFSQLLLHIFPLQVSHSAQWPKPSCKLSATFYK